VYSLLIKNAIIIDGANNPWYKADIAIKKGKIIKISKNLNQKAIKEIELNGEIVSPGFIDIHSHSGYSLLTNGKAESKLRQGVTTEVIGNCGMSAAPLPVDKSKTKYKLKKNYNINLNWSNYKEYLDVLNKKEKSINVVSLIGHGTLREAVMGNNDRTPSDQEMKKMKKILKKSLEEGAAGFSTGLFYPPSSYANTEEIIELARVASEYDAIYATHLRYEGAKLLEGVEEAIKIGRKASIPVQISHHKVTDKKSWGLTKKTIQMMKKAREEGVDVTCDVYPYLAFSTSLCSLLPQWALDGGRQKMVERINNDHDYTKILRYLKAGEDRPDWEDIYISHVNLKEHKSFVGNNIKKLGEELEISPEELVLNILRKEKNEVKRIGFGMCDEDLERVLKYKNSMIGSDGSSLADYGILSKGKPHPRNFGAFPKLIRKYVREKKLFTLEEAIHKMTGLTAWRLGLSNKGFIREGMDSDLVIFDFKEVSDRAEYINPFQYPKGIKYVIIDGQIVIDNGVHTNLYPGKVIFYN